MRLGFLRTGRLICALLALALLLCACQKKDKPNPNETTATPYYTVTFDVGGGEPIADQVVPSGSFLNEPTTPRREGWVFGGWVEEYAGVWAFSESVVERDMTLVATWLSPDTVFAFEILGDAEAIRLTALEQTVKNLEIPSKINGIPVTEIADEVFAELSPAKVARIWLPESIRAVGTGAFRDAVGVKIEFDTAAALVSVGEDAFLNCNGLAAVRFDESMTELSMGSFSGTSLRQITLPSAISVIPENAFEGCAALASVTMSSGVTRVEDSAFYGCSSLRALYFYGDADQLDSLIGQGIANRNDALVQAVGYLYSESAPAVEGKYGFWYFDENDAIKIW